MSKKLVWIDMEMTGLDINTDLVLEVACVITDAELNVLDVFPGTAIYQPHHVLDNMHPWCIEQHGRSGLTQRCRTSKHSVESVEAAIMEMLQKHPETEGSHLCGNSIFQDRKFLEKFMPRITAHLHYRMIDVSAFKVAAQLWEPGLEYNKGEKPHTAEADILASIAEMRHYKGVFFSHPISSLAPQRSQAAESLYSERISDSETPSISLDFDDSRKAVGVLENGIASILDTRLACQQADETNHEHAFGKKSPTHGMTLGQRIEHVGGRTNAQGYVEFGSPMAVHALILQVIRDMKTSPSKLE